MRDSFWLRALELLSISYPTDEFSVASLVWRFEAPTNISPNLDWYFSERAWANTSSDGQVLSF